MSRTHTVEVDIDLDDFSDDEIFAEARRRGLDLDHVEAIGELAFAIQQGKVSEAQLLLERLVAGSTAMIEAARIGRGRKQ